MGNGVTSLSACCTGTVAGEISRRYDVSLVHDSLGHSFCYIRPDLTGVVLPSSTPDIPLRSEPILETTTTTFRSISGASVSANPSTSLSGAPPSDSDYLYSSAVSASAFESSGNFASLPLQPVPRGATWHSGPIVNESVHGSAPFERRFLSGPIESGLYSGPIESTTKKTEKEKPKKKIRRNSSPEKSKSKKKNFLTFKSLFTNLIPNRKPRLKKSVIEPINGSESSDFDHHHQHEIIHENPKSDHEREAKEEEEEEQSIDSVLDVQWAQGKAGEDRVHVVVSEENGWVFVGIYDGFSGPDAPDYLLNNLYTAVQTELNGLLWNDEKLRTFGEKSDTQIGKCSDEEDSDSGEENSSVTNSDDAITSCASNQEKSVKWRCEWENKSDNKTKTDNDCDKKGSNSTTTNHRDVLKALLQALKKTEEAYLELADLMVKENPELALMGSCVLVTVMKGEDVYVMNVGDSRAVLARKPNFAVGRKRQKELERIKEDSSLEDREMLMNGAMRNSLVPLQLNMEHSTRIEDVNTENQEYC